MRPSIRPYACGATAISPELPAYERFLQDLVRNRKLTRQAGFQEEQAALRPFPRLPLAPCREFHVSVSRERSIQVLGKRYSVPSRLIGTTVLVRVRAESVEVYVGTSQVLTLPRRPRSDNACCQLPPCHLEAFA